MDQQLDELITSAEKAWLALVSWCASVEVECVPHHVGARCLHGSSSSWHQKLAAAAQQHSEQLRDKLQQIDVSFFRLSPSGGCVLELIGETRAEAPSAAGAAAATTAAHAAPEIYHSAVQVPCMEDSLQQLMRAYPTSLAYLAPSRDGAGTSGRSLEFKPHEALATQADPASAANSICQVCAISATALASAASAQPTIWACQGSPEQVPPMSARILFVQVPQVGLLELVETRFQQLPTPSLLDQRNICITSLMHSQPCSITLGGTVDCTELSRSLQASAHVAGSDLRVSCLSPSTTLTSLLSGQVGSDSGPVPHMLLLLFGPCSSRSERLLVDSMLQAADKWAQETSIASHQERYSIACSIDPSGSASVRSNAPCNVVGLVRSALRAAAGQVTTTSLSDVLDLFGSSSSQLLDDMRAAVDSSLILSTQGSLCLARWAARLASLWGTPPNLKLIAVDADNTLWSGVLAESNGSDFSSLQLKRQHLELQLWLKAQQAGGAQLVLLTKNNESDVDHLLSQIDAGGQSDGFAAAMLLRRDDFLVVSASWEDKVSRLERILNQLSLSPESTLFIDDSDVEIAAMRQMVPAIASLQWPQETAAALSVLSGLHMGDANIVLPSVSAAARKVAYGQVLAKAEAVSVIVSASSEQHRRAGLEAFFASLSPEVSVQEVAPDDGAQISRFVELSSRANQFVNVKHTWSVAHVVELLRSSAAHLFSAGVRDKFGIMNDIAYALAYQVDKREATRTEVLSFALSCRAMGRGVEHALLRSIGRATRERSQFPTGVVVMGYNDSGKNRPFLDFIESMSRACSVESEEHFDHACSFSGLTPEQSVLFDVQKLASFSYTAEAFANDTLLRRDSENRISTEAAAVAAASSPAQPEPPLSPSGLVFPAAGPPPERRTLTFEPGTTTCEVYNELSHTVQLKFLNRAEFDFVLGEAWPTLGNPSSSTTAYSHVAARLPSDACIFDIGANIGLFSCLALSFCPAAHVVAVEPALGAFKCLQHNLHAFAQLNGSSVAPRFQVFDCACTNDPHISTGSTGLLHSSATLNFVQNSSILSHLQGASAGDEVDAAMVFMQSRGQSINKVETKLAVEALLDQQTMEHVPVTSVSSLWEVAGKPHVHLLKVDVEGSETSVLRSVCDEMVKHIDCVVVECRVGSVSDTLNDVLSWLEAHKFSILRQEAGPRRVCLTAVNSTALWPHMAPKLAVYSETCAGRMPLAAAGHTGCAHRYDESLSPSQELIGTVHLAPDMTALQSKLQDVWAKVLKLKSVASPSWRGMTFQELGGDSLSLVQLVVEVRSLGLQASFAQPWMAWTLDDALAFCDSVQQQHLAPTLRLEANQEHNRGTMRMSSSDSSKHRPTLFVCGPAGDFRQQLAASLDYAMGMPSTSLPAQVLYHVWDTIRAHARKPLSATEEQEQSVEVEELLESLQKDTAFRSIGCMFHAESGFLALSVLNHALAFCENVSNGELSSTSEISCIGHCIGALSATAIESALRSGRLSVLLHNLDAAVVLACAIGDEMDSTQQQLDECDTQGGMYPLRINPSTKSSESCLGFNHGIKTAVPGTRLAVCPCSGHISVLSSPQSGAVSVFGRDVDQESSGAAQHAGLKHSYHSPANIVHLSNILQGSTLPCFMVQGSVQPSVAQSLLEKIMCVPYDFSAMLQDAVRSLGADACLVDLGPAQAGPGSSGILSGWTVETGRMHTVFDACSGYSYEIGVPLLTAGGAPKQGSPAGADLQASEAVPPRSSPLRTHPHPGELQHSIQEIIAVVLGTKHEVPTDASWWELGLTSASMPQLLCTIQAKHAWAQFMSLGDLVNAENIEGLLGILRSSRVAAEPGQLTKSAHSQLPPRSTVWLSAAGFRLPKCKTWAQLQTALLHGVPLSDYAGHCGAFLDAADVNRSLVGLGVSERMDAFIRPHHSLAVQAAWDAVNDAGVFDRHLTSAVGVYVGVQEMGEPAPAAASAGSAVTAFSQDPSSIANLIATTLNIQGPTLTIQAACASSAVAVCSAAQAIQSGQISAALVVGVQVNRCDESWKLLQELGVLIKPGLRSAPLKVLNEDALGEEFGLHRGEGCICVVLEAAVHPPNPLSCELNGWASGFVGQPGAPHVVDVRQCARLMQEACAGTAPFHVEMHATGTKVGDNLELEACDLLSGAMGVSHALGVSKGAFGHTEAASGLVSLCSAWLRVLGQDPRTNRMQPGDPLHSSRESVALVSNLGFSGTGAFLSLKHTPTQTCLAAEQVVPAPETTIIWSQLHPLITTNIAKTLNAEGIGAKQSHERLPSLLALLSSLSGQTLALPGALPCVRLLTAQACHESGTTIFDDIALTAADLSNRVLVLLQSQGSLVGGSQPALGDTEQFTWMTCFAEAALFLFQCASTASQHIYAASIFDAWAPACSTLFLEMVPLLTELQQFELQQPSRKAFVCDTWISCLICASCNIPKRNRQRLLCLVALGTFLGQDRALQETLSNASHWILQTAGTKERDFRQLGGASVLSHPDSYGRHEGFVSGQPTAVQVSFGSGELSIQTAVHLHELVQQYFKELCGARSPHRAAPRLKVGDLVVCSRGTRLVTTAADLHGKQAIDVWSYLQREMLVKARSLREEQPLVSMPESHAGAVSNRSKAHCLLAPQLPTREIGKRDSNACVQASSTKKELDMSTCGRLVREALEQCALQAPQNTSQLVGSLDAESNFIEVLGLDSVACTLFPQVLRNIVSRSIGPVGLLPLSLAFDSPTIASASDFLQRFVGSQPGLHMPTVINKPVSIQGIEDVSLGVSVFGIGALLPGGVFCAADVVSMVLQRTAAQTEAVLPAWKRSYLDSHAHNFSAPGKWLSAEQWEAVTRGLPPSSALKQSNTDPQHSALLYIATQAYAEANEVLAASGHTINKARIGCMVGCTCHDFVASKTAAANPHFAAGSQSAMLAGKVSRSLGLSGPSLTVDTACSSGLVALHTALQSIQAGEIDGAIVAGVNLPMSDAVFQSLSHMKVLSRSGISAPCSRRADGYVRADGAVAFFIHKDTPGCDAFASLGPCLLNQCTSSSSLTAPDGAAQEKLVKATVARAEASGIQVQHAELHGSSTVMGDTIELEALSRALRETHASISLTGSKVMFGHTEGAAGLVGMLCAMIELQTSSHMPFVANDCYISLSSARLHESRTGLVTLNLAGDQQLEVSSSRPSASLVSSFGFSGTNACAVVFLSPSSKLLVSSSASRAGMFNGISASSKQQGSNPPPSHVYVPSSAASAGVETRQAENEDTAEVLLLSKRWQLVLSSSALSARPEVQLSTSSPPASHVTERVTFSPHEFTVLPASAGIRAGSIVQVLRPGGTCGNYSLEDLFGKLHGLRDEVVSAGCSSLVLVLQLSSAAGLFDKQCAEVFEQVVLGWRRESTQPAISGIIVDGEEVFELAFSLARAQPAKEWRDEHVVRLDATGIWARALHSDQGTMSAPNSASHSINPAETFVFLGCGAVAEAAVQWLLSKGALHFVFLSRSGAGRSVDLATAHGASVQVFATDLHDIAKLSTVLSGACSSRQIGGFVHAAGQYFLDESAEFGKQLQLKLAVSELLVSMGTACKAKFVLLLSSCASFWPLKNSLQYACVHAAMNCTARHFSSHPQQLATTPVDLILETVGTPVAVNSPTLVPSVASVSLGTVAGGVIQPEVHTAHSKIGVRPMITSTIAHILDSAVSAASAGGVDIGVASFSSRRTFGRAMGNSSAVGLPRYMHDTFQIVDIDSEPKGITDLIPWMQALHELLVEATGTVQPALVASTVFQPDTFGLDSLACLEVLQGMESLGMGTVSLADFFKGWSIGALFEHALGQAHGSGSSRQMSQQAEQPPTTKTDDRVAIIHSQVLLPGAVESVEELTWRLLSGVPVWGPAPEARAAAHGAAGVHGWLSHESIMSCFEQVRGLKRFPEAELQAMDPHQVVLLATVHRAANDLIQQGIGALSSAENTVGVFVTGGNRDFVGMSSTRVESRSAYDALGQAASSLADRIAFTFGFSGPCCVYDSACASGLIAIHHACDSLRAGLCNTAVVAGCNLILSPAATEMMHAMGVTASEQEGFPLKMGRGYIRSEGCIVMILRLDDAPQFPRVISSRFAHATPATGSMSTPAPEAQRSLYPVVSRDSGQTSWVEQHRTGTLAGDRIEQEVCDQWAVQGGLHLHKSGNKHIFGHTEGVSGLLSVVCATKGAQLVPHVDHVLVNSFGFGGALAQTSLALPTVPGCLPDSERISAKHRKVVLVLPGQGSVQPGFLQTAYSSCSAAAYILQSLWRSCGEACAAAELDCAAEDFETLALGQKPVRPLDLHVQLCLEQLSALCFSLLSVCMWQHAAAEHETVVMGHSMGQFAAAVLAGALTIPAAMDLVLLRLAHLRGEPSDAALVDSKMVALTAGAEQAGHLLREWQRGEHTLYVACINSPEHCTVAGPASQVDAFCSNLPQGVRGYNLPGVLAYHTPLAHDSSKQVRHLPGGVVTLPIVLCDGTLVEAGNSLSPNVWANLTEQQVDFPQMLATASRFILDETYEIIDASLNGSFSVLIGCILPELHGQPKLTAFWPAKQAASTATLPHSLLMSMGALSSAPVSGSTGLHRGLRPHKPAAVPAASENAAREHATSLDQCKGSRHQPTEFSLDDLLLQSVADVDSSCDATFEESLAESILHRSAARVGADQVPTSLARLHGFYIHENQVHTVPSHDNKTPAQELLRHELAVLAQMAPNMDPLWRGEMGAHGILFKNGSTELVEPLYTQTPRAVFLHAVLVRQLKQHVAAVSSERKANVLELGSGTGSLTEGIVQELLDLIRQGVLSAARLVLSDLGPSSLAQLRRKLKARFPEDDRLDIQFQQLDINSTSWGLRCGEFDCICASNMLHVGLDLPAVADCMNKHLRPGGIVLAREAKPGAFLDCTFGFLPDWQRAAHARQSHTALLDSEQWRATMAPLQMQQVWPAQLSHQHASSVIQYFAKEFVLLFRKPGGGVSDGALRGSIAGATRARPLQEQHPALLHSKESNKLKSTEADEFALEQVLLESLGDFALFSGAGEISVECNINQIAIDSLGIAALANRIAELDASIHLDDIAAELTQVFDSKHGSLAGLLERIRVLRSGHTPAARLPTAKPAATKVIIFCPPAGCPAAAYRKWASEVALGAPDSNVIRLPCPSELFAREIDIEEHRWSVYTSRCLETVLHAASFGNIELVMFGHSLGGLHLLALWSRLSCSPLLLRVSRCTLIVSCVPPPVQDSELVQYLESAASNSPPTGPHRWVSPDIECVLDSLADISTQDQLASATVSPVPTDLVFMSAAFDSIFPALASNASSAVASWAYLLGATSSRILSVQNHDWGIPE